MIWPSLKKAIRKRLGKHWHVKISVAFGLVLWPTLVFCDEIKFSPHRFAEEWIKISSTSIIVVVILDIYDAWKEERVGHDKLVGSISRIGLIVSRFNSLSMDSDRSGYHVRLREILEMISTERDLVPDGKIRICMNDILSNHDVLRILRYRSEDLTDSELSLESIAPLVRKLAKEVGNVDI